MATTTARLARLGAAAPPWLPRARAALGQTDILLGLGVVAILVVLILPLPGLLLDVLLALSITFSVLILLTSLLIERPLDFNAFPTVLLIATMLRLSLNLASTRLILSDGHEGPDAAGHVIEAFGGFIMQGNIVIGIIVFGNPGHRELRRHHEGLGPRASPTGSPRPSTAPPTEPVPPRINP